MLIRGHEQHERPDLAPHQPESHGEADDDEGERAALAEEQAGLDRSVARQAEGAAQAGGDGLLEDEETGDRRQIQNGSLANSRSSMPMATDIKKRPSIRPLNGSMSTTFRYAARASSSPARKAPRAIDRPATPVMPMTVSRGRPP
jgi:hypothetical protein